MRCEGDDRMDTQELFVVRCDLLVEVKGRRRQSGAVGMLSQGGVMFVEDRNRSIIAVLLVDCSSFKSAQTYHEDSMASVSSERRFARVALTCKSLDEAWHRDLHRDTSIRLSQRSVQIPED